MFKSRFDLMQTLLKPGPRGPKWVLLFLFNIFSPGRKLSLADADEEVVVLLALGVGLRVADLKKAKGPSGTTNRRIRR